MRKIVLVVLLPMLIFFSACSNNEDKSVLLDEEKIIDIFTEKQGEVIKIEQFEGESGYYALVELSNKENGEEYSSTTNYLIDLSSGEYERIYVGNSHIEKVINENYMIFTSNNPDWQGWGFPYTTNVLRVSNERSNFDSINKDSFDEFGRNFKCFIEEKYLDIKEPVVLGSLNEYELKGLDMNVTGFELLFYPKFYAGGTPAMPRTDISFDKASNSILLNMKKCINTITKGEIELVKETYSRFIKGFNIEQKDSECSLTIFLNEEDLLYNVEQAYWNINDKDELVYARINFKEKNEEYN